MKIETLRKKDDVQFEFNFMNYTFIGNKKG